MTEQQCTLKVIDPNGFSEYYTLRAETVNTLIEQTNFLKSWLRDHGYRPDGGGFDGGQHETGDGLGSFPAEQMTAMVNDGKVYWKVRGGKFQKFGVNIWPEVLEQAGFDPDEMNPVKSIDLSGYTAQYLVEEGKAKKIVKLIKN